MTASPPAAPGMPSEETIARALNLAARAMQRQFGANDTEEAIEAAIWQYLRPAFEAKDAEVGQAKAAALLHGADVDVRNAALATAKDFAQQLRAMEARALSAEAKLAQAVKALEPFAEASSLWENNADDTDLWVRPLSLAERIKARLTVGALRRACSASAAARGERP